MVKLKILGGVVNRGLILLEVASYLLKHDVNKLGIFRHTAGALLLEDNYLFGLAPVTEYVCPETVFLKASLSCSSIPNIFLRKLGCQRESG